MGGSDDEHQPPPPPSHQQQQHHHHPFDEHYFNGENGDGTTAAVHTRSISEEDFVMIDNTTSPTTLQPLPPPPPHVSFSAAAAAAAVQTVVQQDAILASPSPASPLLGRSDEYGDIHEPEAENLALGEDEEEEVFEGATPTLSTLEEPSFTAEEIEEEIVVAEREDNNNKLDSSAPTTALEPRLQQESSLLTQQHAESVAEAVIEKVDEDELLDAETEIAKPAENYEPPLFADLPLPPSLGSLSSPEQNQLPPESDQSRQNSSTLKCFFDTVINPSSPSFNLVLNTGLIAWIGIMTLGFRCMVFGCEQHTTC